MAMRWKRDKAPTGLARIFAGHPGYTLADGNVRFATVGELDKGRGWFWVTGWESGLPSKNTCDEPSVDAESAKAAAMLYVREQLALAKQPKRTS